MRSGPDAGIAVCLLAGGEATRFPGKLERTLSGVPLLRCTYESVRGIGPVTVSVREMSQAKILEGEPVTVVTDEIAGRGPLEGLISAFSAIEHPWIFVAAGDAPYAGRELYEALRAAWEAGCEAVVPENAQGTLQPLTALYERAPFLEAARTPRVRASGAVRRAVEVLRAVRVRNLNERAFFNVNTEADYRAASEDTR
jgi:molybdopterin-guanine dinucleotide biosynthesis protein A